MSEISKKSNWVLPNEVMQLQKLRRKKKALQARIAFPNSKPALEADKQSVFASLQSNSKRKNPFQIDESNKKSKISGNELGISPLEESSDQTLFKLIHLSDDIKNYGKRDVTNFKNALNNGVNCEEENIQLKSEGKTWIPVDWSLKTKIKFLSTNPFPFNHKLKISEEASGVTSFTRCLDITNSTSSLDASIKSQFHQCCLYWQQPYLPWMELFPRNRTRSAGTSNSVATSVAIKDGFHNAYADSLRSLFHLIRTKQCCYFYLCTNHYTILFRAAGMSGFSEIHALITPTTKGFRQLLKKKEIEFIMPLKKSRYSDVNVGDDNRENDSQEVEDPHELSDEEWLESMGIGHEDIKQINYAQEKINHKQECTDDNNEQSLVLVEGVEVQALYNMLINSKGAVPTTGPYTGIPPTLLAPVAFHGATLCSLKVKESKAHLDNEDYYALEVAGPILPHMVHSICDLLPKDQSFTVTHANLLPTVPFSKITSGASKNKESDVEGSLIFRQENLSDCGLKTKTLKQFCADDEKEIANVECVKYSSETMTYSWT